MGVMKSERMDAATGMVSNPRAAYRFASSYVGKQCMIGSFR